MAKVSNPSIATLRVLVATLLVVSTSLVACSLEQRKDATLRLDIGSLGGGSSGGNVNGALVRPGSSYGLYALETPLALGDFECAFINVTAPDIGSSIGGEPAVHGSLDGSVCGYTYPGIFSPAIALGAESVMDLKVPRGSARIIQVIGYRKSADVACDTYPMAQIIHSRGGTSLEDKYGQFYEVGRSVADINGDAVVTISAHADWSTRKVECGSNSGNGESSRQVIVSGKLGTDSYTSTVFEYNAPTSTWSELPSLDLVDGVGSPYSNFKGLTDLSAAVIRGSNGKLVIGGGLAWTGPSVPTAAFGNYSFVLARGAPYWNKVVMPQARAFGGYALLSDRRVLVFGGQEGSVSAPTGVLPTAVLDPDALSVNVGAPLSASVGRPEFVPMGVDRFLVAGGTMTDRDVSLSPKGVPYSAFLTYVGGTVTETVTSGLSPRGQHTLTALPQADGSTKVVAISGVDESSNTRDDFQILTVASNGGFGPWSANHSHGSACASTVFKRLAAKAVPLDSHRILVIGGKDFYGYLQPTSYVLDIDLADADPAQCIPLYNSSIGSAFNGFYDAGFFSSNSGGRQSFFILGGIQGVSQGDISGNHFFFEMDRATAAVTNFTYGDMMSGAGHPGPRVGGAYLAW